MIYKLTYTINVTFFCLCMCLHVIMYAYARLFMIIWKKHHNIQLFSMTMVQWLFLRSPDSTKWSVKFDCFHLYHVILFATIATPGYYGQFTSSCRGVQRQGVTYNSCTSYIINGLRCFSNMVSGIHQWYIQSSFHIILWYKIQDVLYFFSHILNSIFIIQWKYTC